MDTSSDSIELSLPFKAEYVSVARLTVSGIASRIGFDIETVEDIKVAVAEVCNKLVSVGSKHAGSYKIIFKISGQNLTVDFCCDDSSLKCIFNNGKDELSISIISALMDAVEFCSDNSYLLSMSIAVREDN